MLHCLSKPRFKYQLVALLDKFIVRLNLELDKNSESPWEFLLILKVYLLLLRGSALGVRVSALGNMSPSLN